MKRIRLLTEENARLTQNNEGRDLADFAPEQQVRWEKEKKSCKEY